MSVLATLAALFGLSTPPQPPLLVPIAPPAPPAPPASPAPVPGGAEPVPRSELQAYIGESDYPVAALAKHLQGIVGIRLIVGTDGRVLGCTIAHSSGVAVLDEATCRILRSRARFTPAPDALG